MILVLALLGYAAVAAVTAPALLTPLTRRGRSARAGLAAWLAAMAGALGAALAAAGLALRAAVADWPQLTQTLCRSVAGDACTPAIYRSALYQVGVAALALGLTAGAAVAAGRYARRVRRSRAGTRTHARAALLVGRALTAADARPASGARTVVLDDPRPAAYCVAGHPSAIVVTSGALAVLEPPQLRAVLAHERAHIAHRHHTLTTVVRGLAAALPGVPLFPRGLAEVARLAEMAADDSAARAAGRVTVASALIALATGQPAPAGPPPALAAAAHAVPERVGRLLAPSRRGAAVTAAALLGALAVLLIAGPALLALLA